MSRPMSTRFLVRPLEAVYFGPPQSFSAGEAHRADSAFPPSCFTFQGMVRSQLLRRVKPMLDLDDQRAAARAERAALVGGPDALPAGWQLTGPLPARVRTLPDGAAVTEPWVPTPRLLWVRDQHAARARIVNARHPAMNDLDGASELVGCPQFENAQPGVGWVDPVALAFALTGTGTWPAPGHAERLPPFVRREHRPGLALEGDTARHGMLYFLGTLRFEQSAQAPSGLLGWLRGDWDEGIPETALASGLAGAGRKERPVAFIEPPALDPVFQDLLDGHHLPTAVDPDELFWLVTTTPVALDSPTAPVDALGDGVRFETVALLSGQSVTLGGYRYADARTRPNREYLAAGTCWLFRLTGGDAVSRAEALRRLNNCHRFGDPLEAAFGFGHTLVGLGPQEQE